MAPVTANEIKNTIADPNDTLCSNFIDTLLKLPVLIWKWFNYVFKSGTDSTLSAAFLRDIHPTGTIRMSAQTAAEDENWLLCNGQSVSKTTYAALYAAIGATYGAETATNFTLPDCRDRFPVGAGSTYPITERAGGTATLVEANLPAHRHNIPAASLGIINAASGVSWTFVAIRPSGAPSAATAEDTSQTGSGTAFNVVPKYIAFSFYIKT